MTRKNPLKIDPIGIIHSPFKEPGQAPRQGSLTGEESTLEIFDEYIDGLKSIEGARHLVILYWLDRADRDTLQTVTPWGPDIKGVFACRSPSRPNPIAFCVVELLEKDGNRLIVKGLDALDNTPLLDIKPYSPSFDSPT